MNDFSNQNLSNQDLRGKFLFINSDFSGANLEGVNLSGETLTGSTFKGANLRNAKLMNIRMPDDPVGRHWEGFSEADLTGADFTGAFVPQIRFDRATLNGVIFRNAEIAGCRFLDTDVGSANFEGVNPDFNLVVGPDASARLAKVREYQKTQSPPSTTQSSYPNTPQPSRRKRFGLFGRG